MITLSEHHREQSIHGHLRQLLPKNLGNSPYMPVVDRVTNILNMHTKINATEDSQMGHPRQNTNLL